MVKLRKSIFGMIFPVFAAGALLPSESHAGVFNLPRFVAPSEFAIGVEPELLLTPGAALGVNLKYSHGMSDLSNLTATLGTGGGDRQFRAGVAYTFDFFPDGPSQPGIGLAFQGFFIQRATAASVEMTAVPYIHKSVKMDSGTMDPFLAFPMGMTLTQGAYQGLLSVVLGSQFRISQHISTVAEFGLSLANANTYLSGGLIYYH